MTSIKIYKLNLTEVVDTLLAATAIEADLYLVSRNVRDLNHSGAAVP